MWGRVYVACLWKSGDTSQESVPSFNHVSPGPWTLGHQTWQQVSLLLTHIASQRNSFMQQKGAESYSVPRPNWRNGNKSCCAAVTARSAEVTKGLHNGKVCCGIGHSVWLEQRLLVFLVVVGGCLFLCFGGYKSNSYSLTNILGGKTRKYNLTALNNLFCQIFLQIFLWFNLCKGSQDMNYCRFIT